MQAFDIPCLKEAYIYLFTHIIENRLSFDKVNLCKHLLLRLNPTIRERTFHNFRKNNIGILRQTTMLEPDEDTDLLWSQFSDNYESSSFLLTEALFNDLNALARGDLAGKRAHSLATEITQKMKLLSQDSIAMVTTRGKDTGLLLVKSPQITIICAIVELFIFAPNFNLLLSGLKSFAHLVASITEATPKEVSQKDFNTLLVK